MNKKSYVIAGILVAVISLLIGGCNKPTAEMKRAQAAIDDARKAGASEYATAELASAEQALSQGKTQMDNLSYKKARASFEEAYRLALKAKEIALKGTPMPTEKPVVYAPVMTPPSKDVHTVVKGECLWYISENRGIYSDPFQWPLIYDANRAEIDSAAKSANLPKKKPDGYAHWIFPGQNLDIPQDASMDQIKNARSRAGAPTPYMAPGK
ncbi:MAG TPA: DUF4398 domain-containing protein [bacterium]|nr:DUF4398 domain-containing protein [bacterium]